MMTSAVGLHSNNSFMEGANFTSPSVLMSSYDTTSSYITDTTEGHVIESYITDTTEGHVIASNITVTDAFESVDAVLLGVLVLVVVIVILILLIVVLRYMAHQKGSYYTHEEALGFKSDPNVQEVLDMEEVEDIQEDPEEEES